MLTLFQKLYSTTARISPEYRPRNAPSKMVDFCMHIDPTLSVPDDDDDEENAEAARRIDQLRRSRPDVSINHTNYPPLVDLPIAVSIETKKGTDNWDRAVLQMGTWQAAHLRRLANAADPDRPSGGGIMFLPGIIIMGHFWHFVVTVREDGAKQPILLSSILVGSTDTVLGLYKVLAGVSRLRRWSKEEFWPDFKREVLGMGGR